MSPTLCSSSPSPLAAAPYQQVRGFLLVVWSFFVRQYWWAGASRCVLLRLREFVANTDISILLNQSHTGEVNFEDVTDAIGMASSESTLAAGCIGEYLAAQVRVEYLIGCRV